MWLEACALKPPDQNLRAGQQLHSPHGDGVNGRKCPKPVSFSAE